MNTWLPNDTVQKLFKIRLDRITERFSLTHLLR